MDVREKLKQAKNEVARLERIVATRNHPIRMPTMTDADLKTIREALALAEDVLSRRPFSAGIWPNGMHPATGIEKIREALRLAQK